MSYVRPKQLAPVKIMAPSIDIDSERVYGVLKCPQNVLYQKWVSNSFSTSSAVFNIPPPSSNCITSREAILYFPCRVAIKAVCPSGGWQVNQNWDAPRSFPVHNIIQSVSCTLNTQTLTNTPSEWISALQHFNMDHIEQNETWSSTPTYPDQYSIYNNFLNGNIGSPFTVTSLDHNQTRGTFPFIIVQNDQQVGGVGMPANAALVDCLFIEKIMLPPLEWGCKDEPGFANLNSMNISFNFLTGSAAGNRIWSHVNNGTATAPIVSSYIGADAPNTGINVYFGANNVVNGPTSFTGQNANTPMLFIKYYQTAEPIPYNMTYAYSYSEIQRYVTSTNINTNYVAPALPYVALLNNSFTSSNVQLSSIPTKIYCFIRPSNSLYQGIGTSNTIPNGCTVPDAFCPITSLQVQWGSRSGLLASASQYQLYQLALKHGCTQSWQQWSGGVTYSSYNNVNVNTAVYYVGGIVCFSLEDIGLDDPRIQAPGTIGQYNLQISGSFQNTIGNYPMDCYVVVISEGAFEITQNSSSISIAPLSEMDVMDAQSRPGFNYNRMRGVDRRGGSFLDSIKSVISGINDFFKEHKLVSRAVGLIPHPVAQAVSTAAEHFGYGAIDERMAGSGVVLGGKKMSHKQLAKRIGY